MSVRIQFSSTCFYAPPAFDDCNTRPQICLPVYQKEDIQFQFLIICTTLTEDTAIRNGLTGTPGPQIKFSVGAYSDCLTFQDETTPPDYHATLHIYPLGSPGSMQFLATLNNWTTDKISTYAAGNCIYLNILMEDATELISRFSVLGCCGCLQKIADPCFTSVLKYRNNEDAFYQLYNTAGFNAADEGFYNSVRLPFYLHSLQLPTEEKTYTRSDGSKIQLYARMDREYSATVDYLPKEQHLMLATALRHDTVFISSVNENGIDENEFVLSEAYQLQWTNMPRYPLAQATFKVQQSDPVQLTNNYCN